MNPLFIYLLKASTTVFFLWAFYSLCLRRMTFHRLNRYFFLTGILVSLLWPALPLTEWFSNATQVNQVVVYIPVSALMMQFKPAAPTFGFEMLLRIVYFGGILFMLVRLSIQIFSLRAIFKKSEIRIINGVKVHVVNEKINPFSFFGYIFLNPANHTPAELSAIILHEKVHESRTHSVDILLSELFKIMLWFNPFSWLFCRAVKENIEFEVDRLLLHQGIDCKEYQYSLLKLSSVKNQIVITNHFNLSNLKTRIIMMNKNQSSRYGLAAYALVIPLILLCMVFSYAFAQNKPIADTVKHFTFTTKSDQKEPVPEKALIILDGKVIDKAKMDAMNPEDIYSVNVLKGKDATDIYGRKGKNGVVLVTSKQPGSEKKTFITYRVTDSLGQHKGGKPTIYVNGKEISESEMKDLDPKSIMTINVTKDDPFTKEFGEKGKNGVIRIQLKNSATGGESKGSYSTTSTSSSDGKTTTITTRVISSGSAKGEGKSEGPTTMSFSTNDDDKTAKGKQVIVIRNIKGGTTDEKVYTIKSDKLDEIKSDKLAEVVLDGYATKDSKYIPDNAYVLIDGKEGKMDDVKKENIEKIEILKGGAATATYGDKGKNGVILITTRKK